MDSAERRILARQCYVTEQYFERICRGIGAEGGNASRR